MAPTNKIYLITGTTRGIGRGLVSSLLQQPNTTIIAGVRDPSAEAAKSLDTLPKAEGSNLIIVAIDAASPASAAEAVASIQKDHGITALDTVIANAGVMGSEGIGSFGTVTPNAIRHDFEINTLGPLYLFQATLPLLQKSQDAKFVVTTSAIGSTTLAPTFGAPTAAYGVSKAAVNHLLRKASGEYPNIAFVPIHPGLVHTDMGGPFAERNKQIPSIGVEESVKGYLEVIEKGREELGGKFWNYDGTELPW